MGGCIGKRGIREARVELIPVPQGEQYKKWIANREQHRKSMDQSLYCSRNTEGRQLESDCEEVCIEENNKSVADMAVYCQHALHPCNEDLAHRELCKISGVIHQSTCEVGGNIKQSFVEKSTLNVKKETWTDSSSPLFASAKGSNAFKFSI